MATHRSTSVRLPTAVLALLASSLLLTACGGGGGGNSGLSGTDVRTSGNVDYTPDGSPSSIVLRWDPSPVEVTGYTILSGPSPDLVTDTIFDIAADGGGVDPSAPAIGINAEQDLGMLVGAGSEVCFAVRAYNYAGESPASEAVCTTI